MPRAGLTAAAQAQASAGHRRLAEISYAIPRDYGPTGTGRHRRGPGAFRGSAASETSGGFGNQQDVGQSWRAVVRALHRALSHWPATTEGE